MASRATYGYADIAEGIGSSEFSNTVAVENDKPNRDDSDWRIDLWRRGAQWNLVASGDPQMVARSSNTTFNFVSGDATALYNSISENLNDVSHVSRSISGSNQMLWWCLTAPPD